MILIDLLSSEFSPIIRGRRRLRARRAAMSQEQRERALTAAAARMRARRVAQPDLVRGYENTQYREGKSRPLKLASARRSRLRSFGLTPASYAALRDAQGDRCACCATTEPGRGHKNWCIDHDHKTGRVRGLLCHRCNAGIGLLGDGVDAVRKALAYLERTEVSCS